MPVSQYLALHEKYFCHYDADEVVAFLQEANWLDADTQMTKISPGGFGGWETQFELLKTYQSGDFCYMDGIWLGDIYNPESITPAR